MTVGVESKPMLSKNYGNNMEMLQYKYICLNNTTTPSIPNSYSRYIPYISTTHFTTNQVTKKKLGTCWTGWILLWIFGIKLETKLERMMWDNG